MISRRHCRGQRACEWAGAAVSIVFRVCDALQFTETLDVIESELEQALGISCFRIDGSQCERERRSQLTGVHQDPAPHDASLCSSLCEPAVACIVPSLLASSVPPSVPAPPYACLCCPPPACSPVWCPWCAAPMCSPMAPYPFG